MSQSVANITAVKETLSELLQSLSIVPEKVEVTEDGNGVIKARVQVDDNEASLYIGAYGATLNALQVVLKSLLWKQEMQEKSSVRLDINDYRQKQEDRMTELAKEKAETVKLTGMRQAMPPMSAYMRRIVHLNLASNEEFADVETVSAGEGHNRRLYIQKKGTSSIAMDLES